MVPMKTKKQTAMNIRDRKILPILMTLLGLMGALTSCHREDPTPSNQTDIPITFAPSSDWPTLTKVSDIFRETGYLYDEPADLAGDGILIWGKIDGAESVFDGVLAKCNNNWDYGEPPVYWRLGKYSFASILPASKFNGTYTWDDTKFTFNPALDLSVNQIDVMVASAQKEFTLYHLNGEEIGDVQLNFAHTLSLLNITLVNGLGSESTITVNSVKLYGPHTTASSMTNVIEDGAYKGTWDFVGNPTAGEGDDDYYHYEQWSDSNPTSTSSTDETTLVENLLVFPEKSSSMLTIEVKYTETLSSAEYITTRKAQVPMDWTAGKPYTYKLQVTPSSLLVLQKTDGGWTNITVDHDPFE